VKVDQVIVETEKHQENEMNNLSQLKEEGYLWL
jgi:hypothetical protein